MNRRLKVQAVVAGALMLCIGGVAVAQSADTPNALRTVQRGQWQLKDANGGLRKMCVAQPSSLVHIAHGKANCQNVIIENGPETATVRYTCSGRGHGRTTLRVETGRLISIDTQGVVDGAPFAENYEARYIGAC